MSEVETLSMNSATDILFFLYLFPRPDKGECIIPILGEIEIYF